MQPKVDPFYLVMSMDLQLPLTEGADPKNLSMDPIFGSDLELYLGLGPVRSISCTQVMCIKRINIA